VLAHSSHHIHIHIPTHTCTCTHTGETLEVTQAKITTDWFRDSGGLGLALGLHLSFARIATGLNDNASPWIAHWADAPAAGAFATGVCALSLAAAFLVVWFDSPRSRLACGVASTPGDGYQVLASEEGEEEGLAPCPAEGSEAYSSQGTSDRVRVLAPRHTSPGGDGIPRKEDLMAAGDSLDWQGSSSSSIMTPPPLFVDGLGEDMDGSRPPSPFRGSPSPDLALPHLRAGDGPEQPQPQPAHQHKHQHQHQQQQHEESPLERNTDEESYDSEEFDQADETIHLSQWAGFKPSFWVLLGITLTIYGSVVPFFHICTDFFQSKWYPGDARSAGFAMSIPDIVSAVGMGWICEVLRSGWVYVCATSC
jgi:hypothetical protein